MTVSAADPRSTFRYRAAHMDGSVSAGTVAAPDAAAAADLLASQGLYPIDLRPTAARYAARGRPIDGEELATGLHAFAVLLEAGLPVSRALSVLETLAPASWLPLLAAAQQSVREGRSLADALSRAPVGLPEIVIGLVQAGEAGSGLASAVRRAAEHTEQQAALRAAIRGALTYPAIVAVTGAGTIALMVGIVLPRFATLLGDLGATLPWSTRLVLAAGSAGSTAALPLTLALMFTALGWRTWVSRPSGRVQWHTLLRMTPGIGGIRRAEATSRACGSLAALLDAGVPLASGLRHAAAAGGDAALEQRLLLVRQDVVRGSRLADAVTAHDAFTPTAARLLQAGEASGALTRMLAHAARLEAERTQRAVRTAVRLVEPALILLLGGVIAFVAAALLQAVYSIRPGS